ncbi:MAG: DUF4837 family protein [Bacteroidales bacterium]|nr:DUF4837 family protein [Bacteroidales bacterium]
MNRLFVSFLFVTIGLLVITGCNPEKAKQQQGVMPSVTGKTGELIVVMDTAKFRSEVGLPIKKQLSSVFKGLPQPEPIFNLINIPPKAFDKGFKTHRNVLRIHVARKYSEPRFVVRKGVHSKSQILIEAQAPNDSLLQRLFREKGDVAADRFVESEWNRYLKAYRGMRDRGVIQHLREKFNIEMVIPKGFKLDKDTTNFSWLAKEDPEYSQGFLVYKYPYNGEKTFTLGYQIRMRDRFTKKFVPGPSPGSYMITETMVTPFFNKKRINNHTVYEMRGLWKVKNDFMGGPFVSYSIYNENSGEVVTVDGFVYAPRFNKRDYVRQMEAILQSLELVEP